MVRLSFSSCPLFFFFFFKGPNCGEKMRKYDNVKESTKLSLLSYPSTF